MTPYDKFSATKRELGATLIERDTEIDLALTALVCQEHVLYVGPPGTAKSMLANAMVQFIGGEKFSILLSKFSTPEELYGPISVVGLKADKYRRIIDGTLATATIGFVDEVFKASSAILNTLLTIMNERYFRNDGHNVPCPLVQLIGALSSGSVSAASGVGSSPRRRGRWFSSWMNPVR